MSKPDPLNYQLKHKEIVDLRRLTHINGPARIGSGQYIIHYHFKSEGRMVDVVKDRLLDALRHKSDVQILAEKAKEISRAVSDIPF